MVLILSSIPLKTSTVLFKMISVTLDPNETSSRMLNIVLKIEASTLTCKLLAVSGVELIILLLEGIGKRPRDARRTFRGARDSAVPARVPSPKNKMFVSLDRLSMTTLRARHSRRGARGSLCWISSVHRSHTHQKKHI